MSISGNPNSVRLLNALGSLDTEIIDIDAKTLADSIWLYLKDVAHIHVVSANDLSIYLSPDGVRPTSLPECLRYGSRFFDSIYYLALGDKDTVDHRRYDSDPGREILSIKDVQRNLLLMYLYIMFRGNYPASTGTELQRDIPTFLSVMLGMNQSPSSVSQKLASFNLNKVPLQWVKHIPISQFSPEIQQRIALGSPGYRMMMPFVFYNCKPDAAQEVKDACEWVRKIASKPADWDIFSATRSAQLTQRVHSFNKSLGNLMLLAFTPQQLDEMASPNVKIIFRVPVRDPRSDGWKSWTAIGDLDLNNPILTE